MCRPVVRQGSVYPTLKEGTCVRGEHRASKGVSNGETGPHDANAADAWPSEHRGAEGVGAKGERGASKDASNRETGSRDGADTWPSGRRGSDGDSSAFKPVGGGDEPLAVCPIAITGASRRSVFTGRMPFLPPNQQRQSTEGKDIHTNYIVLRCFQ